MDCALHGNMCGYILAFAFVFTILPVNTQEFIHVFLEEELPGGTVVADIINEARIYEQYDVNELSLLSFQITTRTEPVYQYFRIPTNTSNLVTKDKIDRDTLCAYRDSCTIELDIAVEPALYFQILKFMIHITDINDNRPTFLDETISLPIPETAAIGASYDLPAAEDLDAGNFSIQEYELLNFQDLFELRVTRIPMGTDRVSIVLKDTLDREMRNTYQLSVVAKDGGAPPLTGSVIIQVNVLDTNDNNPEFENEVYEYYLSENNEVGSTVIRVRALDPDEGASGEIEYAFERQTQAIYGALFQINSLTGVITTKDVIDFEQNQEFNLRVVAKDKGPSGLTGYSQVVIIVRDLNDNAPQISVNTLTTDNQAQAAENRDAGQFVAHVSVTDPDGGANGEVTCSIDNHNFNLEELASFTNEYKITTAVTFNRESQSEYSFTMTCRDRGNSPQISNEVFVVRIIDENDHAPVFPMDIYDISLHENSGIGITVLQVNATDADAGPNARLTFGLDHIGIYGSDALQIDPESGIITTRISLDYELHTHYSFYVTAHDNGTPQKSTTASLIITVLDINDNAPRFSQPIFSFTVPENSPLNTIVGEVLAFDLDSPPYNQISYSLMSHGFDDHFNIDPRTGEISVTTILDREQMGLRQKFDLVARASNDGYGLQNSVEVTIFVEDVNDNYPVISYPSERNNTVKIKSKAKKGRFVATVEASDLDIGRNGLLSYTILEYDNGYDLFSIDRHTGSVYVEKDLHKYGNEEIELKIKVSDNADTPLSSRASLHIYINKTSSPSEKQLVTNLNFVIAVVVTSVILVAVVVVIFVIFMMRRSTKLKKATTVYSYRVDAKDETDGKDGDDQIEGIPTVSGTVPSTSPDPAWPDVIDANQIALTEKPYYDRRQPNGNNYVNSVNPSKRVHFKDSLESVHSAVRHPANKHAHSGPFLGERHQGHIGNKAPVYLDEGRHKLLYGADPRALQLTSQNLQTLHRGKEADELSDQGSSVDSGRGPSEEDQDPLRSSGSHNNSGSLNDSRESGECNRPNRNNNYMDMNQARTHTRNVGNSTNLQKYSQRPTTAKHKKTVVDSGSSFQSDPPLVPPRGTKPPMHPRTAIIHPQFSTRKLPRNFPDLNVPAGDAPATAPTPSNSNTAIGKYNVRTAANTSRSQALSQPTVQRCYEHNVVDHFPELCQRQSIPLWAGSTYVEPDSRSDGGSTTSGSYVVDGSADHMDLGPEISRDVFV